MKWKIKEIKLSFPVIDLEQKTKRLLSKIGVFSPIEQLIYNEKEVKTMLSLRIISKAGKQSIKRLWCLWCGWGNHTTPTLPNGKVDISGCTTLDNIIK